MPRKLTNGNVTGGSGSEPGGPGLTYLVGDNIRNLRVDNNCQKAQVWESLINYYTITKRS